MTSSSTLYCGCYARWRPSRLTLEQQQDDSALRGLPWWLRQRGICLQRRRPEFSPGREAPPEEGMATHPRVLAGEARGQGSLLGRSPWGRRVRPDWARARWLSWFVIGSSSQIYQETFDRMFLINSLPLNKYRDNLASFTLPLTAYIAVFPPAFFMAYLKMGSLGKN